MKTVLSSQSASSSANQQKSSSQAIVPAGHFGKLRDKRVAEYAPFRPDTFSREKAQEGCKHSVCLSAYLKKTWYDVFYTCGIKNGMVMRLDRHKLAKPISPPSGCAGFLKAYERVTYVDEHDWDNWVASCNWLADYCVEVLSTPKPTTQATTQALTHATTQAMTEASTELMTEAMTEPMTEAMTEPAITLNEDPTTEDTLESATESATTPEEELVDYYDDFGEFVTEVFDNTPPSPTEPELVPEPLIIREEYDSPSAQSRTDDFIEFASAHVIASSWTPYQVTTTPSAPELTRNDARLALGATTAVTLAGSTVIIATATSVSVVLLGGVALSLCGYGAYKYFSGKQKEKFEPTYHPVLPNEPEEEGIKMGYFSYDNMDLEEVRTDTIETEMTEEARAEVLRQLNVNVHESLTINGFEDGMGRRKHKHKHSCVIA